MGVAGFCPAGGEAVMGFCYSGLGGDLLRKNVVCPLFVSFLANSSRVNQVPG